MNYQHLRKSSKDPLTNLPAFYYRYVTAGTYSPDPTASATTIIINAPEYIESPNFPADVPTRFFVELPGVPDYVGAFDPTSGRNWTIKRKRAGVFTTFNLLAQDVTLVTNTCKIFSQASENGAFMEMHAGSVTSGDQIFIDGYFVNGVINENQAKTTQGQAASVTIASYNSSEKSRYQAEVRILEGEDAAVKINAAITALSTANGGTIILHSGVYLCKTQINLAANVILSGEGASTVLTRDANTSYVISLNAANCGIKDLLVDGTKATYTGSGVNLQLGLLCKGVISQNNSVSGFGIAGSGDGVSSVVGCKALTNTGNGFNNVDNLTNCEANLNGGGFATCNYLSSCIASSNTGIGYNLCLRLSGCQASGNGGYAYSGCENVTGSFASMASAVGQTGFYNCLSLSGCKTNGGQYGYESSKSISACYAEGANEGFRSCRALSGCLALLCGTTAAFFQCRDLTSCFSDSATGAGFGFCLNLTACHSTDATSYGFSNCRSMGFNSSQNSGAAEYFLSYADSGTAQAVADNANGGYNS